LEIIKSCIWFICRQQIRYVSVFFCIGQLYRKKLSFFLKDEDINTSNILILKYATMQMNLNKYPDSKYFNICLDLIFMMLVVLAVSGRLYSLRDKYEAEIFPYQRLNNEFTDRISLAI